MLQVVVKLALKFGIRAGLLVVLRELAQREHERLGHKAAAVRTETAVYIGNRNRGSHESLARTRQERAGAARRNLNSMNKVQTRVWAEAGQAQSNRRGVSEARCL